MKKIVVILSAVLTLGITANSFAGWLDTTGGNVIFPTTDATKRPALTVKPSANVFFYWAIHASGLTYTVATTHTSGSFTFGTSSGDTNIFRLPTVATVSSNTVTTAPAVTVAFPTSVGDAANFTGWTAAK